ncbi:FAD-dependent oxidoreductase [Rhodoferax sp. WC2427]|uniref:FAD-dependent oxidoreductase n=1 Tax=Rhodoferax sp. WC2427 TaxID=3234144 RepID=UPI0034654E2E
MHRRHFLATTALPLLGCAPTQDITGGFTGIHHARGHLLREARAWPAPNTTRRTDVLIAGGGVAGLAAARALRLKGVEDFALLELEDSAGGNSRGGSVGGIACPLGAHYLPVPGDDAPDVQNLLEELGLRQRVAGRWVFDERHLCHSPQERLFLHGAWQDGLLPLQGVDAGTLAQYRQFAGLVAQLRQQAHWTIPLQNQPLAPIQKALAAITFAAYLDQHGLQDSYLRWYLDYCCRDDFGAGTATVSAWAGIHYFASRHGFHAPGTDNAERDGVLTWPEGNAWLTRRLAAPLGDRLHTGQVVLRIAETRQGVEVDAFDTASQTVVRWQARKAIVALPVFIAARVVQNPPDFLAQAAARTTYAPWLVANIHIDKPLHDRPGPAPSWDNVLYGAPGLGYVDAMHQSLRPVPAATVLTYYRALGDVPHGRQQLMEKTWSAWRDAILAELATAHPDLAGKTTRVDITRYGHAMAIPTPAVASQIGLQRLSVERKQLLKTQRLDFAHSDWAGYSVFEEAFTRGHHAGGS